MLPYLPSLRSLLVSILCASISGLIVGLLCGCGSPQIGFQPLGHDNRLADEMRAGDDQRAGRDLRKSQDTISDSQNKIEAEAVRVSQRPTVLIVLCAVGLPLLFCYCLWATDRYLLTRRGLLTLQQAVADERNPGLIGQIKPVVRAMGPRAKRQFDRVLRGVKHG